MVFVITIAVSAVALVYFAAVCEAIVTALGRRKLYHGDWHPFAHGGDSCARREMSNYPAYYGDGPESEPSALAKSDPGLLSKN